MMTSPSLARIEFILTFRANRIRGRIAAAILAAGVASTAPAAVEGFHSVDEQGWFIRAGSRLLFNAKASVNTSAPLAPGFYDDGFVLPDIGGSASGLTWNWGYASDAQVTGGQIQFGRIDNAPAMTFQNSTDSFSLGAEILVGAEVYRSGLGERGPRIGYELGYGYNPFRVKHSGMSSGTATFTQESYGLGGITPPQAPYDGTFAGPGPLLDLNPSTTSTITSTGQSTFSGEIESELHNLKIGVWFELPMTERFRAAVSLGYSSLHADTRYTFTEDTTYANPAVPVSGPVTRTVDGGYDWNPGFYFQTRLGYAFTPRISAEIAADYQYNGRYQFSGVHRDVTLDFRALFAVRAGLGFDF